MQHHINSLYVEVAIVAFIAFATNTAKYKMLSVLVQTILPTKNHPERLGCKILSRRHHLLGSEIYSLKYL